jgi:hypothetical protein
MEEDPTGRWVNFSDSADRIEALEKALKAVVHAVGLATLCADWCPALTHEDDPIPNPYCECGACDLIDRADEAQLLLNELCTCTPSKHYVFCVGEDECTCGDSPKHDKGCNSLGGDE